MEESGENVDSMLSRLTDLSSITENLKAQVQEFNETKSVLVTRIDAMVVKIKAIKTAVINLKKDGGQMRDVLGKIKAANSKQESQLGELKTLIDTSFKLKELNNAIGTLEEEVTDLQNTLGNTEDESPPTEIKPVNKTPQPVSSKKPTAKKNPMGFGSSTPRFRGGKKTRRKRKNGRKKTRKYRK